MSHQPLVSVIVPTHNRPDMLAVALESLTTQTLKDIEVIVVNDAGRDVASVVERFSDRLAIRYLNLPTNRRLAGARNAGLEAARGKYIAYLDDDDAYYPNHLEVLATHLERSGGHVAYTDANRAEQVLEGGRYVTRERRVIYSHDFSADAMLITNYIPVLCVMHARACVAETGGFDESLPVLEDWDMWIRMSRIYPFTHLTVTTCEFTWRPDGNSMTFQEADKFAGTRSRIFRKYDQHFRHRPELVKVRREMFGELAPDPAAGGILVPAPYQEDYPELRGLVPASARRVLDLTCGVGLMGGLLKRQHPGIEVVGVEGHRGAALAAAKTLDAVIQGEAAAIAELPYPDGHFDCLLLNGSLAPVADLTGLLARFTRYVREGGHAIVGLPNVRHYEVVGDLLLEGAWRPERVAPMGGAGFTYSAIEAQLAAAGLPVQDVEAARHVADEARLEALVSVARAMGRDEVAFRQDASVKRFGVRAVKQAALLAEPAPAPRAPRAATGEAPVASIVMLTLNQLAMTQLCVESLLAHSTLPFELIVVDNASTDGTRAYLRELAGRDERVKVIYNAANMGFAHGCNQGIACARGEVVVLLNNDTVVTEGWLEGLVQPMLRDGSIGAVGPRTNQTVGPQLVTYVPYGTDLPAMHRYARRYVQRHAGMGHWSSRLIGFCVAIRRVALETIGGLDGRFGVGNFEDDDLSLRLQTAGFKLWVTDEVFIHHFGHATFIGERVDLGSLLKRNGDTFARKWGLPVPLGSGYPGHELAKLPFDRTRDVYPILVPEAPPAAIEGARGFHFVALPDWSRPEAVVEAIAAYNQAFTAADDVALLLWVDPMGAHRTDEVASDLIGRLEAAGLTGDDTPELVLFDAPGNPMVISSVYRAGQVCLPLGRPDVAAAATTCGLTLIDSPTPEALRAAVGLRQPVA
jgi:GT2 family glycosyltransferase/SAM-dependent methyltransferase